MRCILLVGKFPKPSDFPLTTYNTTQRDFAEDLEKIFQKVFLLSTPDLRKCQRQEKEKRHNPKVITAYSTI